MQLLAEQAGMTIVFHPDSNIAVQGGGSGTGSAAQAGAVEIELGVFK